MLGRKMIFLAVWGVSLLGVGAGYSQDAQADKKANGAWERSLTAGLNANSGNKDAVLGGIGLAGERTTDQDLIRLGVNGAYGETEGETTAENAKAVGRYEYSLSERMFAAMTVELGYDSIADVDYRLILSPALGYYLIKEERVRFNVEAGPSYIVERVGGIEDDYLGYRIADRFEWDLSETSKFWQATEFIGDFDNSDNFLVKTEVGLEAALVSDLSLAIVAQDTYDNEPAPGLKENDLSVMTSLKWSF